MTLLLAARHATGWAVGADSIAMEATGEYRSAPVAKLLTLSSHPGLHMARGGWRSACEWYVDRLQPEDDVFSQVFQAQRLKELQEALPALKDHGCAFYLFRDDRLMVCSADNGDSWEATGGFYAFGQGDGVANYLLHKRWTPGLTSYDAERLLLGIFAEVAIVAPLIAAPWQVVST